MKKSTLIYSFALLVTCNAMAQKQDSVPARSLSEKGAQGDIHLGKEIQKNKLMDTPQRLEMADPSLKKETHSKKKKTKQKKI